MKGQYLLTYVFTQNNTIGVGSADMTLELDQPITPEIIHGAIKNIRENYRWDASVIVTPVSWCRYEQPTEIINRESSGGGVLDSRTNGDCIRQMTDEELVNHIGLSCKRCIYHTPRLGECTDRNCTDGNLEWLRREAN